MLIRNKSFYMFADAIAVVVSFILALLGRFASLDAGDFQLGNWYGCILMLFIYIVVILFYQPDQPIMKRNRWNELRVVITDNFYMAKALSRMKVSFLLLFRSQDLYGTVCPSRKYLKPKKVRACRRSSIMPAEPDIF